MSAHAFRFPAIDGGDDIDLAAFAGRPVLIVNTASECGFTLQYAGLEALWQRHRDAGLVVVGVPSNDFGGQEPGTNSEVAAFCEARFGVTFPLAAKQAVIGGNAHPFFRWLTQEIGEAAAPRWNFHKYLLDGAGDLVDIYPSRTAPDDPALEAAIAPLLDPAS